jgi:hypothetical protein
MKDQMHHILRAIAAVHALLPACAVAAEDKFLLELNTIEPADNRCRMNFVIENESEAAVDTLKLDLVVFGTDGGIMRRLITDMAPIRAMKTMVRAFLLDADCHLIGAILVNEVAACAPGAPNACLDRLELSSRVKDVRLYK